MVGVPLLMRTSYALIFLALLSYLWTALSLRGLEARVRPEMDRSQVGQYFEEKVTLVNISLWPKALLKISGSDDLPGHSQGRMVNLSPGGQETWMLRTKCLLRGLFRVGLLTVESGDPWGLFQRRRTLGTPGSLLVYPATLELPHFLLPSLETQGDGQNQRRSILSPPTFSSLRDYAPGDSFSRIHWPTTARTGRLIVKDFRLHPAGEVWILLDMHREAQAGSGAESTEEYAVTIAASIARQHLDANYAVGLLAQGDHHLALNPQRGRYHLWHILEALATIRAQGRLPLSHLLAQESTRFGYQSTLVMITPAGAGLNSVTFQQVLPRGTRVAVIVLEAASFGGKDGSSYLAQHLSAAGIDTYLVRQGEDMPQALDSRVKGTVRIKHDEISVKA